MQQNLKLLNLDEIMSEEVRWLWKPYIPLGKISLVQGNPGMSKSTAILSIAADLTKGNIYGESDICEPSAVIYQTTEDGYADVVKPRLQRLGRAARACSLSTNETARCRLLTIG